MSALDWLIIVPLLPLAPVVIIWWLPWERWIPWSKFQPIHLGLYFVYATFACFHFFGREWVVLGPLVFAIYFLLQGLRSRSKR